MKKDKYFRTTNFSIAMFLFAHNQQVISVDAVNYKQKEFVFIQNREVDDLVELYRFGNKEDDRLRVNVHKYEQGRRELLDRLND